MDVDAGVARETRNALRDGLWVTIERGQRTARAKALEQRCGVAAAAQRNVEIRGVGIPNQEVGHLLLKDGVVIVCHGRAALEPVGKPDFFIRSDGFDFGSITGRSPEANALAVADEGDFALDACVCHLLTR